MGKQWKQCQTLVLGAPKSLQMVIAAMKLKDTYSLEGETARERQKLFFLHFKEMAFHFLPHKL